MINMTIREMMIYVEVAFENLEQLNKSITKKEMLDELSFLAYHQNKNTVLKKKNYKEKFF